MKRRIVLILGLLVLLMSGVRRVTAAVPGQIEAEGYGGESSGGWACGPSARATYAGGGLNARVYPSKAPPEGDADEDGGALAEQPYHKRDLEPEGASMGGGGGVEQRGYERTSCAHDPCGPTDVVPEGRLLVAGHANLGVDWRYLGLRVGAMVFPMWSENDDHSTTAYVIPDLDLRFGRRMGFHGGLGVGGYNVSTLFRPGAYAALGVASESGWGVDLRGGPHVVFDNQIGFRGDLSARYEVFRGVAPGLGLALSAGKEVLPEGRFFLVFTP